MGGTGGTGGMDGREGWAGRRDVGMPVSCIVCIEDPNGKLSLLERFRLVVWVLKKNSVSSPYAFAVNRNRYK
jgi:hypothetical protein